MIRFARYGVLLGTILVGATAFVLAAADSSLEEPPNPFRLVAVEYRDLDGDHDRFPDTGETGRIVITVENTGPGLTAVAFSLVAADSDFQCATESRLEVASVSAGERLTLGSLDPAQPGFTFKASDTLETSSTLEPARIDLCLRVAADELPVPSGPGCFQLTADVDLAAGETQVFTLGTDGLAGTADDGITLENFDLDKDGDGSFTVNDSFLQAFAPADFRGVCSNAPTTPCRSVDDCPAATPEPICYSGAYLRGSDDGADLNTLSAVVCGGFDDRGCELNPLFPMDWHLHCPPHAKGCLNLESGDCLGGCSFKTPSDGAKALSLPNSLHMGAHFRNESISGDTTHTSTLQGFMSAPLNLALQPRPGDLRMSFFHIARLMDNNGYGSGFATGNGQCYDCADVQFQIDNNPDPLIDEWGFWDRLVPFQNVYDHVVGPPPVDPGRYYETARCQFTPADTGPEPPAPRGVHETLCSPQGAWSSCGSVTGPVSSMTGDCEGPGTLDPSGNGVWVETKFELAGLAGQRVRFRFLGEGFDFRSGNVDSYYEAGGGRSDTPYDDGWWLDDIRIGGTIRNQATFQPDAAPPPGGSCPSGLCRDLDEDGFGGIAGETCLMGEIIDCDDRRASVHPGAVEVCNNRDDDCDQFVDEDENGYDTDSDAVNNLCDNCVAVFNPLQEDCNRDGVGDACEQCVCGACDQRVVDLTISNKSSAREGTGTLSFRTTMEEDIAGFYIVFPPPKKLFPLLTERIATERLIPPPLLRRCKECITGRGASYSYVVNKHKNREGFSIIMEHKDGRTQLFGPAKIVNH